MQGAASGGRELPVLEVGQVSGRGLKDPERSAVEV